MAALPLSYLAMETGWVTREVGRQPWVIHGLLRTGDAASRIPAGTVAASLAAFALVYAFLAILFFCLLPGASSPAGRTRRTAEVQAVTRIPERNEQWSGLTPMSRRSGS